MTLARTVTLYVTARFDGSIEEFAEAMFEDLRDSELFGEGGEAEIVGISLPSEEDEQL